MSDFMRLRIITEKWQLEEWDIDSIPSPSLYPLQQGKVHKPQIQTGIQRQKGEKKDNEKRNNIDSKES
tara:strand:+ start:24 stop:227 length:204 start_codon:yes stop_codon:yes gene_type:complete